jgi:hypothetical protein
MTIKDSHVGGILQRLESSTGLQLRVEENESDGNRVKEMLGFSNTKSGIYTQLLTTNRVIAAMLYNNSGLKPL